MTTRTRRTATTHDPNESRGVADHGANDGPTVRAAPDDAVRGGLSVVARGVGSGLAAGAAAVRRLAAAVESGPRDSHRR